MKAILGLNRVFLAALAVVALALFGCTNREEDARLAKAVVDLARNDTPLTRPVDLSLPAIIEARDNEPAPYDPNPYAHGSPRCNGYCLRLLYTGEARTVITGFSATPGRADAQGWFGGDMPGRRRTSVAMALRAFHLEQQPSCPPAAYNDTADFYHDNTTVGVPVTDADAAALKIRQGLCLVETRARIEDATVVMIFTSEHAGGGESGSAIDASHLTVYARKSGAFYQVYRHTRASTTSFVQGLPKSFDDATFGHTVEFEQRSWPEIVRNDLGMKLSALQPSSSATHP